jgi:hypothetical protein
MRTVLAALPWSMPVAGRCRVLGWVKMRGITGSADPADDRESVEIFTDLSAADCKNAATGGQNHALDLAYYADGRFEFTPLTSQGGKIQIISRLNDRRETFTTAPFAIDLGEAPNATIAEMGATDVWFSDAGTTGGGTLTQWTAEVGGRSLAPITGEEPAVATVLGKSAIRFTRASVSAGDRLSGAFLPVAPTGDFTQFVLYSVPSAQDGQIVGLTHQGTYHAVTYGTGSGQDIVYARSAVYSQLVTTNQNGIGGHVVATNALKFAVLRRSGDVMTAWLGMGQISESTVIEARDNFPTTGTFHLTVGAGLADSGNPNAPFEFRSVDVFSLGYVPRAWSEVECLAAWSELQTRFY